MDQFQTGNLPFDMMDVNMVHYAPQKIGIGIDFGMTFSGASIYLLGEKRAASSYAIVQCENDQSDAPKFETLVFVPDRVGASDTVGHAAYVKADNYAKVGAGESGELFELFKRYLGEPLDQQPKGMDARRYTTEILKHIKKSIDAYLAKHTDVGGIEPHYRFTLPGMWEPHKVRALNQAIRDAGFEKFGIMDEPTAMAVAASRLGLSRRLHQHNQRFVLICDFGGGTFDLSLISTDPSEPIRTKATPGGNPDLGMSNLDKALQLLLLKNRAIITPGEYTAVLGAGAIHGSDFERLWQTGISRMNKNPHWLNSFRRTCESLKKQICRDWEGGRNVVPVSRWLARLLDGEQVSVTREEVAPLIKAMQDAAYAAVHRYLSQSLRSIPDLPEFDPQTIRHVLVGGGGANLPGIDRVLKHDLPRAEVVNVTANAAKSTEVIVRRHAMGLVQLGAAIVAAEPDIVLERRAPASYGMAVWSTEQPKYPDYNNTQMSRMFVDHGRSVQAYIAYKRFFTKSDILPSQPLEIPVYPISNGQPDFRVPIFTGEDEDIRKNRYLGTVHGPLPRTSSMADKIRVECSIGEDGEFHVIGYTPDGTISPEVRLELGDDDI